MPRKTSNTLTKKRNGATPKIKHGKLNNGMKYILNNTKCGDKSTIMLFVKVGSRDESRELNEAFGEKVINSYIKLKNNEINNFNAKESFSKEKPITDWEKLNTLDC